MNVTVCYASIAEQVELLVDVAPNATVIQAINASGILAQFGEIDLQKNQVGIFSRRAKLGDGLQAGDRIEIYRPLTIDPKEARRQRAL